MKFLIFEAINLIIGYLVMSNVQQPYMDEPFHLDLQEHYQNEEFSYWNPKLTTPPGLYFMNYFLIKALPLQNILTSARVLNLLYQTITFFVLLKIFNNSDKALLFIILPSNFFYNHLFYTDTLSTTTLALSFYLITKSQYALSALFSLTAILTRQTNAVWTVYICLWKLIDLNRSKFLVKDPRLSYTFHFSTFLNLLFNNLPQLIRLFKYHITIILIFMLFVLQNGGIALGDKTNHQFHLHGAQLPYLILFMFMHLPISPFTYYQYLKITICRLINSRSALTTFSLVSIAFAVLIHYQTFYFSIIHPFILADNRHYIFYIWKNFFGRYEWFRYAMILPYSIAAVFLFRLIICKRQDQIITMSFLMFFSSLALVPAGLIEFRYFTPSLLFLYFEMRDSPSNNSLLPNLLTYSVINIVVFFVFLFKPFACDFGSDCRFMF